MIPCIYKIRNVVNDKFYVGSAINFRRRKRNHFRLLRSNKHHNRHLQRAFNLYGESNFVFEIVEYVNDTKNLISREDWWIDALKPEYNIILSGVLNHLGLKRSEETKQKISQSLTGKHVSEDVKQKLRLVNLGKKQTSETIQKKRNKNFKPIIQSDLDGNLVKEWKSATDAQETGQFNRKCIYRCLWKQRPHYRGFTWSYKFG